MIYAPGELGYGHISRMSNLSRWILQGLPFSHITYICGTPKAADFIPQSSRFNFVLIPPWRQSVTSKKESRREERKRVIEQLLTSSFDYIIIEHEPFGIGNELKEFLRKYSTGNPSTQIILSIRGVLFSKERSWDHLGREDGIKFINSIYSKVIVFSDPRIINLNKEYSQGLIDIPICYVGYIFAQLTHREISNEGKKQTILINMGGGYKCDQILTSLIESFPRDLLTKYQLRIAQGEFFEVDTVKVLERFGKSDSRIEVLVGPSKEKIYKVAVDFTIGVGGYNVTAEAIFNQIPLLLIPKTFNQEAVIHSWRLKAIAPERLVICPEAHLAWSSLEGVEGLRETTGQELMKFDGSQLGRVLQ